MVTLLQDALALFAVLAEEFAVTVSESDWQRLLQGAQLMVYTVDAWLRTFDPIDEAMFDEAAARFENWARVISPMVGLLQDALDVFAVLAEEFTIVVSESDWQRLLQGAQLMVYTVDAWLRTFDPLDEAMFEEAAARFENWASVVGPMVGLLQDALALFVVLAEEFTVTVSESDWQRLLQGAQLMVYTVDAWLRTFDPIDEAAFEEMATRFENWASVVGPMVGLLRDALALFEALSVEFTVVLPGNLQSLIQATQQVALSMAGWLASIELSDEGIDAVAEELRLWAERLSPVLSIVRDAIGIFQALEEEFTVVLPGNLQSLIQATQQVALSMAGWLASIELSDEGIDAVAEELRLWAERLSPVLSIVRDAIGIFQALQEPVTVMLPGYLQSMVKATEQVVAYMAHWLGAVQLNDEGVDEIAEDLKHWAERVDAIATILTRGMAALSDMKAWQPVTLLDIQDKMTAFAKTWAWLVEEFDALRKEVGDLEYEIIREFAETTAAIASGLQEALGFLTGIADYVSPAEEMVRSFTADVKALFRDFYDWVLGQGEYAGGGFEQESLEVVAVAAVALQALMAGLESALAVLSGLTTYVPPTQQQIDDFTDQVQAIFLDFYTWASGRFEEENLLIVSAVGAAMRDLMGGLESALALLSGLRGYVSPTEQEITDFEADVMRVFGDFYDWITGNFTDEGLLLVEAAGSAISSLMQGLSTAFELFQGLTFYVSPFEIIGSAIDDFIRDTKRLFTEFYDWVTDPATGLEQIGLEITQAFGDALQSLMAGLAGAVEVLSGVGYLFHPSYEKLTFFMEMVQFAFTEMHDFARTLDEQQLAITGEFNQVMSDMMSAMSAALGLISKLTEGPLPPVEQFERQVSHFIDLVYTAMQSWYNWIIVDLEPQTLYTVAYFTDVIKQVVDGMSTALGFLVDLGEAGLPSPEKLSEYLDLILQMYQELAAGLGAVPGQVTTAAAGVSTGLNTGLQNLPSPYAWKVAGGSYPDWLATGIDTMLGEVKTAVGGVSGQLDAKTKLTSLGAWLQHGIDLVWYLTLGLKAAATQAQPEPATTIKQFIVPALALPDPGIWQVTGYTYMEKLASGLENGLALVKAQMDALKGLFPSSPAEWGPFSTLPDEGWVTGYMAGMEREFQQGLASMGGLPALALSGANVGAAEYNDGWNGERGGMTLTVNLHDATIRSDDDVHRLAQELAYEIRRQVGVS